MEQTSQTADILLVDDSVLNVMVLADILEGRGHKVRVASEGLQALDEIHTSPPEIVLLDIIMPDMDGFEICERLKADEGTRRIPIIFLSALHDLSQKTRAFALGGVDYVTKPFEPQEVLSRIETHLTIGRLQKELEQKIVSHERDKAELRQYRDHLEDVVKTRTSELLQEIDERTQTEYALLESQKEWERTFDTIPDMIAIIDKNHRIVRLNQAMRSRLHDVPEDAIAHSCHALIHGTTHAPASCPYSDLLKDGRERKIEIYEEYLHGHFVLSVSPFYGPNGELAGCVHVMHDITERKEAEEALRESEARFRSTFEQAAVGIAHITLDGRFLRINQRFCDIVDYERDDIIRTGFKEIIHADDLEKSLACFQDVLEDTRPLASLENRCLRKDASSVWVNLTMSLVRDAAGEPKYFMSVIEDISQRKEADAERLRLETQLRQAQRLESLGTLSGGIAHDFNNILGTMQGYTEFLLTKFPEESKEKIYLARIFQAGKRAAELVRRILTFSRAHEQQLAPTDIRPLLTETIAMLRSTIPANIKIHHHIQADCRQIMADSAQVHQVLMNLCLNAKQAMQEHGGVLELSLREITLSDAQHTLWPDIAEGSYLQLTVKDSGSGMTEKVKERIFDPFFTTRATSGGTGLGLSVVHGIVKGHHAEIQVESAPRTGTTFYIFFPIAPQKMMLESYPKKDETDTPAQVSASGVPEAPKHILIVDDERDLCELFRIVLSAQGYRVSVCYDGVEALRVFQNQPEAFDVLFTDQNMPDMTGEQLIQHIVRIRNDVPIILATGYSDVFTQEKALALGVRKFLMKPVETRELLALVRKILEESK